MGLFYGYVGVVGFALWAALRFFGAGVGLAQVWCSYGYSMAVFVPMAALCAVPVDLARWLLVGAATATSATFLLATFRQPVVEAAGVRAAPVLLAVAAAHAALGLALKLYFFHY